MKKEKYIMAILKLKSLQFTDSDLDFIIRTAMPDYMDKEKIRALIREDNGFKRTLVEDDQVFRRVIGDEAIFLKISPALYFEILLRRARRDMEKTSHTLERIGGEQVPVFDSSSVANLLKRETVLEYLADMLVSFTRTESYTIPVRVRKGIWRKISFSDMDIDSLAGLCQAADEEDRFTYYKRIADLCLFIVGVFPEYTHFDYRRPGSAGITQKRFRGRRGLQDYEEEGRKFYKLAAGHETADALSLSEVLQLLQENFNAARKPLNFISQHYFARQKQRLFGSG